MESQRKLSPGDWMPWRIPKEPLVFTLNWNPKVCSSINKGMPQHEDGWTCQLEWRQTGEKARLFLLCSSCGLLSERILGWLFPQWEDSGLSRILWFQMAQSKILLKGVPSKLTAKINHHSQDTEDSPSSFSTLLKANKHKQEHKSKSAVCARERLPGTGQMSWPTFWNLI